MSNFTEAEAQILAQEQWAIELLARETHTEIPEVQELFLAEFARLTAAAHIQSFVPLLAGHCVRQLLGAKNASMACPPQETKTE